MQAVILAGGLGTRLRSVIGDLPKSLAPVQGRPFLEYQIEQLRDQAITHLVLCVGYGHDLIQAHLGDGGAYGVQIRYSVETEPLGTGGALRQAQPYLDETFLVLNGDTYFATDLSPLVTSHTMNGTPATLALVHVPDTNRYGRVTIDQQAYVAGFDEKGRSGPGLINAGVYAFSSAVFDHFADQTPLSLETDVFPGLVRQRLLRGCILQGYHVDIGIPASYSQFQADVTQASHAPRLGNSVSEMRS